MDYSLTSALKIFKFETAGKRMRGDVDPSQREFYRHKIIIEYTAEEDRFFFLCCNYTEIKRILDLMYTDLKLQPMPMDAIYPKIPDDFLPDLRLDYPPPHASKTYVKYPPLVEFDRSHGVYTSQFFLSEIMKYLNLRGNPHPNIGESLGVFTNVDVDD